jgi:hypothetical protein
MIEPDAPTPARAVPHPSDRLQLGHIARHEAELNEIEHSTSDWQT